MAVSSDKLDSVSLAIGKILTDVDLESLVAKATGEDIYNVLRRATTRAWSRSERP